MLTSISLAHINDLDDLCVLCTVEYIIWLIVHAASLFQAEMLHEVWKYFGEGLSNI